MGKPSGVDSTGDAKQLLAALVIYRQARMAFLEALDCSSNRDPLAEFSERLAAAALGGRLAPSRVQKGWDVELPDRTKVQVRYLANPLDAWVNEHHVQFDTALDWYALVVFEGFEFRAMVCFPRQAMGAIGGLLGKRHPDQARSLQLTQANFKKLLGDRANFEELGVRFLLP